MAAKTSVESLQDEASPSICLELFQDPVSIHCGLSFCRACITWNWEGLTPNFSCLRCRETVEGGENLCKEPQEALKLCCEDGERLICVVCDRSKVHRNHSVVPMDEAAQVYKLLKWHYLP
ncbi:PREDICTED: E3 ubiquitin-protein ligase TRIM39-like [Nipponia nippon]|uniref:E3 ubiquitin-protein ligase TRIM39-like n=1 Tax=Nipponia nippon TaxID=128390 RepID=UPI000510C8C8|nr:PREDICTED: E3 ubiquitin-protein ligase TRIM39-like [Nipponia nippon]